MFKMIEWTNRLWHSKRIQNALERITLKWSRILVSHFALTPSFPFLTKNSIELSQALRNHQIFVRNSRIWPNQRRKKTWSERLNKNAFVKRRIAWIVNKRCKVNKRIERKHPLPSRNRYAKVSSIRVVRVESEMQSISSIRLRRMSRWQQFKE